MLDFTYPRGSHEIPYNYWATQANTSLDLEDLPSSLSICTSVFPKSFVIGSQFSFICFFSVRNQDDEFVANLCLSARPTETMFYATFKLGELGEQYRIRKYINANETLPIYHKSWIRACISLDTAEGVARIVADGKVLEDASHQKLKNLATRITRNMTITVGSSTGINAMFSDLNVFSELLSLDRMVAITTPGSSECGSRGDLLNWDEAKWTLSDKWANGEWADWVLVVNASKLVELDWIRGPCWRPSKVKLYQIKDQSDHSFCMKHCQKIGYGRSPSVVTKEDLMWLWQEVDHLPAPPWYLWLSATEGDSGETLSIILSETNISWKKVLLKIG